MRPSVKEVGGGELVFNANGRCGNAYSQMLLCATRSKQAGTRLPRAWVRPSHNSRRHQPLLLPHLQCRESNSLAQISSGSRDSPPESARDIPYDHLIKLVVLPCLMRNLR